MNDAKQKARLARQAAYQMATLDNETKNQALLAIAAELPKQSKRILAANQQDLQRSEQEGLAPPLLKRLKFDHRKLQDVVDGLTQLAGMPDPVGRTQLATRLDQGLNLYRVTCPLGVVGVIFESRPDALVQISSLALKSGNVVLLKGGSAAIETNRCLANIIAEAGYLKGLPEHWLNLLETRADISLILDMDQDIDLLIPRGSNSFIRYIMDNTRIPVLGHADGVCHLYIDAEAEADMAIRLALDSKVQYVAVCNAVETILLHQSLVSSLLKPLANKLQEAGVSIFGCEQTSQLLGCPRVADWHHEYLDYQVSLRIVPDADMAISHINQYGSGHTDAIVTSSEQTAKRFLVGVDSGNVFWNASTRFCDGFRYGFGAEVGISTSKIHARGPVGIEGLLTYQYRLLGQGQTVADYADGKQSFSHLPLDEDYPL